MQYKTRKTYKENVFHVYIDKIVYILSIFSPAFTAVHSIFTEST